MKRVINMSIQSLIENKEYSKAIPMLEEILKGSDEHEKSLTNYSLGQIYEKYDNQLKNSEKAKEHYTNCAKSDYPVPEAFIRLAYLEKDTDVIKSIIDHGLLILPNNPRLLLALLISCREKSSTTKAIKTIIKAKTLDQELLCRAIREATNVNNWSDVNKLISLLKKSTPIDDELRKNFELVEGFALIECKASQFSIEKAKGIFLGILNYDCENFFHYLPTIGYMYTLALLDEISILHDIILFFPNYSDFSELEGPWYRINLYFHEYAKNNIFPCISKKLKDYPTLQKKLRIISICMNVSNLERFGGSEEFKEDELNVLEEYYHETGDPKLCIPLAIINLDFGENVFAYKYLLNFILSEQNYDLVEILHPIKEMSKEEIEYVVQDLLKKKYSIAIDERHPFFIENIFNDLVEELFGLKEFHTIVQLCSCYPGSYDYATEYFKLGYAHTASGDDKNGEYFYISEIEHKPDNAAAINNLGAIYEQRGDIKSAQKYYIKAYKIDSENKIIKSNYARITQPGKGMRLQPKEPKSPPNQKVFSDDLAFEQYKDRNIEAQVEYLEEKINEIIHPFMIDTDYKQTLANHLRSGNLTILRDSIEIAVKYLIEDEDKIWTRESVENYKRKIIGISINKKKPAVLDIISHIVAWCRKKFGEAWNEEEGKQHLLNYFYRNNLFEYAHNPYTKEMIEERLILLSSKANTIQEWIALIKKDAFLSNTNY